MEDSTKLIIGFVLIIILVFFSVSIYADKFLSTNIGRSYDFCKEQGYDSVNLYKGVYSEYYGKVECVALFGGDRETEIFEVKENWRGKLDLK